MTVLVWRHADSYRYKKDLRRFRCTDEVLRWQLGALGLTSVHPRPWEYRVQEVICDLRPPLAKRRSLRLGFEPTTNRLGAVMVGHEVVPGEQYDVSYAAVSTHFRGQGGEMADEMVADHLEKVIVPRCLAAGGQGSVRIVGMVDRRNLASQKMFARNGFSHESVSSVDPEFDDWTRTIDLRRQPASG